MGLEKDPFYLFFTIINSLSPLPPSRKKELIHFLSINSIPFSNLSYYHIAFIHKSLCNENPKYLENNERLEILGDSVLSLLAVEYLYQTYPNYPEGKISKIKSFVVSEPVLTEIAKELQISHLLLMGKGERETGGSNKSGNLSNAFEAFLGAFYLDCGFENLRIWFTPILRKYINETDRNQYNKDSKTRLQEYSQKIFKILPIYTLISEEGLDHDKIFTISVSIKNKKAIGVGNSKRNAEKQAAEKLWKKLNSH